MTDKELQEIDECRERCKTIDTRPLSSVQYLGKEKREAAYRCIEHLKGFSCADAMEIITAISIDLERIKDYQIKNLKLTDEFESAFQ